MRYSSGSQLVPRRDRAVAQQAKGTFDEVRLKALQADGAMALGNHLMQGLVALDEYRLSLAQGDPIRSALLMEIEASTIRQCKVIQNSLYNQWGV